MMRSRGTSRDEEIFSKAAGAHPAVPAASAQWKRRQGESAREYIRQKVKVVAIPAIVTIRLARSDDEPNVVTDPFHGSPDLTLKQSVAASTSQCGRRNPFNVVRFMRSRAGSNHAIICLCCTRLPEPVQTSAARNTHACR